MSIATEIARIQGGKSKIVTKPLDFGPVETGASLDAAAAAVEGIENRGAVSATMQADSVSIPARYISGCTVKLNNSVETALAAI